MLSNEKQLDSAREETHVVSVMIEHLETDAIRDKKDSRPLLHPERRHRLTERNLQKVHVSEVKVLLEQETEFPYRQFIEGEVYEPVI